MDGRARGRAHKRTRAPAGHVDRWMSGRGRTMGGRADRRTRAGTRADGWTGWRTGGRGRTGGRRISEGKTPNLTRQLTWLSEIQRGCPRVTVKLLHLPPPSR